MTEAVELPVLDWIWLTAISGIISNIGWEIFTYLSHAFVHSFSSAWHEFRKLPSHAFSIHAPVRVVTVVVAALAVISLVKAMGGPELGTLPNLLLETCRSFAHGMGDTIFAAIIAEETRGLAYDVIIAALVLVSVVWRTIQGWRHYQEFRTGQEGSTPAISLPVYFGLQLLAGVGAVLLALVLMETSWLA